MKNTIERGISARPPQSADELREWVQREAFPLLQQIRSTLCGTYRTRGESFTSAGDGAWTTVWTGPAVKPGEAVALTAAVTAYGSAKSGFWKIFDVYANYGAGTVLTGGGGIQAYSQASAGLVARLAIDAAGLPLVQVQDDGATPFRWSVFVEVFFA